VLPPGRVRPDRRRFERELHEQVMLVERDGLSWRGRRGVWYRTVVVKGSRHMEEQK
jgi:elongation factor P hydroxylase